MSLPECKTNMNAPAELEIRYVHEGDYIISFSKDISVGGMFIFTENPFHEGDTLKMIFSIGDLKEAPANAEVVWVNHCHSKKDRGIGVRFLNLSSSIKEAILKSVNRVAILTNFP